MKYVPVLLLLAVSLMLMEACNAEKERGQKENTLAGQPMPEPSQKPPETFKASGTVISIPPGKRNIIVRHGDIPGFMDAMTMPFPVKDSTVLKDIAVKDSISFIIQIKDQQTSVTRIQKVN